MLATAAGGCVPAVYNTRPEIRGSVTTTEGKPIPGATVRVRPAAGWEGPAGTTATSGADGKFRLPPSKKFGVFWLTQDPAEWHWDVKAEAPGHTYASTELEHRGQRPPQRYGDLNFRLPATR
jgi:hypothetical protein